MIFCNIDCTLESHDFRVSAVEPRCMVSTNMKQSSLFSNKCFGEKAFCYTPIR